MSTDKTCLCGPGYATPMDAFKMGPREKLLYVITVQPNTDEPHGDYLSTVDVDPDSPTFCQVIYRTFTNRTNNEIHHCGWNTCSSCYELDPSVKQIPKRDKLILPCLISDRIYVIDTGKNPRQPELFKEIDGDILRSYDVSAPHTTHCLPNGNIMISTMGTAAGKAKGDFILFNGKDFNCTGTWTKGDKKALCGYDYWYQPYYDIMVASEWGAPELFRRGYKTSDLDDMTQYGRRINFYQWSTQKLIQTVDLGEEGTTPLEIRFLHDPKEPQGYVGTALYSKIYHFTKKNATSLEFDVKKVVDIPGRRIKLPNGNIENLNGMLTDILVSLDDKYLYLSNWLHGDVRQYDITDRENPKLTGQIFLGGKMLSDSGVQLLDDDMPLPEPTVIKGRRLYGGPQMLQLSLDGKRLYVSSSLFSPWDKQFYPETIQHGGTIVQIDCLSNGGMKLNLNFLVDFSGVNEPYGPSLPHEMRYPGGDCTSDIWLVGNNQK